METENNYKKTTSCKIRHKPSFSDDRSTCEMGAASVFDSNVDKGKDVDLMVSIQGSVPVYLTVQRALPA